MSQPWHQLPDETDEDFKRFLCYLSCGMSRSITRAYQFYVQLLGRRYDLPKKPSAHWWKLSAKFNWQSRACRFDIDKLQREGEEIRRKTFARFTQNQDAVETPSVLSG